MKFIKYLVLVLSFTVAVSNFNLALADTYFIERNRTQIVDHGNANTIGSLAWHFAQYGENNSYILTTPASGGSYGVYTPLSLPSGSTLESGSAGNAWIRAYADLSELLNVSFSSTVSNVVLDGNYKAIQVIKGSGADNFLLEGSTVRRTKNDNGSVRTRAHLVNIQNSSGVNISNNFITQAGDSGIPVAGSNNTEATGLYLTNNTGIDVTGNTISYVLSAGINTTNSMNVNILNNVIDNTGRANKYGVAFAADAITAYHNENLSPNIYLYYSVRGNQITNWYNHGIHLSGKWLDIKYNSVYSPGASASTGHAIFVGDYRIPIQCSSVVWIQNNYVIRSRLNVADAADGIRMSHYKHTTYWPSQNTGDVGNGINVTDHRYNNIGNQPSCTGGYAQ